MSKKINWDEISNFSPSEFIVPDKMHYDLVYQLQDFRTQISQSIFITSAYDTNGHAIGSMHYVGKAVDIIIPGMNLLEAYLEAERWPWGGIGVYPHWCYQGKCVGGLHLDIREVTKRASRWWFDNKRKKYSNWDAQNVRMLIEFHKL